MRVYLFCEACAVYIPELAANGGSMYSEGPVLIVIWGICLKFYFIYFFFPVWFIYFESSIFKYN